MALLVVDAFSKIAVGARICRWAGSEKEKAPLLISEIMEMMRAAGAPGMALFLLDRGCNGYKLIKHIMDEQTFFVTPASKGFNAGPEGITRSGRHTPRQRGNGMPACKCFAKDLPL
jgi:hypothetical protein